MQALGILEGRRIRLVTPPPHLPGHGSFVGEGAIQRVVKVPTPDFGERLVLGLSLDEAEPGMGSARWIAFNPREDPLARLASGVPVRGSLSGASEHMKTMSIKEVAGEIYCPVSLGEFEATLLPPEGPAGPTGPTHELS